MVNLIGSYECKVDTKGRLMVPAPLKKQLVPILQEGFVLKRSVFNHCLELYPMKSWNSAMADVNTLNRFVKKNVDFIRVFTAGVKVVEVDANGRLLIPRDLMVHADIDKDIVLSGAIDKIEIWDKEKYENSIAIDPADFAALAEDVMGNNGTNGIS